MLCHRTYITCLPENVKQVSPQCFNHANYSVHFLQVIYHPLYSMNNFVTNKSKLPQDRAQVFPYMG